MKTCSILNPNILTEYAANKPQIFPSFYLWEYHGYIWEISWEYNGNILPVG
jgi:hypothetical protein